MDNCTRTEEDVLATLSLSKLNVKKLSKPSQTLYFSKEASDQEFTLIQLNKEIIEHINSGEDLVIRGNENDSATLCTSDRTYDIKKARTSNTLLFVPKCSVIAKKKSVTSESDDDVENCAANFSLMHRQIIGWSHDYLELKRIQPQTNRIKQLLADNPYQGPEKEDANKKKYTLTELLDMVQASEGELMSALFKLGICCIDGYWRVLDFGYIVDCVGEICSVIDSESWNIFNVPLKKLCEKINDSGELVPEFIVHHLMAMMAYGSVVHKGDVDYMCYKLDEAKLCRFFAEMLLRDVGKFNLSEFLEVWEQSVPDGLKPNKDYLRGLAIIDNDAKPATIQHFSVEKLPQDTAARFDILFQTRSKWSREEIEPYIEDLCLEGQTTSALLTKYARSSLQNGSKVYCSRKTLK